MSDEQSAGSAEPGTARKAALSKRIDSIGWGLFFIWVGIAVLADVGWGVGLLGVGMLALAEQAVRSYLRLKVEAFWVVVGALLIIGGGWETLEHRLTIVATVLIVAGVAMLVSAFRGDA